MKGLAPYAGNAHIIGITGSPGVGKSTSTGALVGARRTQGKRVGVLAVDPSSPFSGGALLGDRIRMQDHALDPEVYIRSMASRGHLGGLSWAAPQALRVLDAAGCDVVLVETVGVGQSEVEIASMADTTLVLLAPGMGDGIQAAKAGILEIGDLYVINKADRDGADTVRRELRGMLGLSQRPEGAWMPEIIKTVAMTGEGVDDVVTAIDAHLTHLKASGELAVPRPPPAPGGIAANAVTRLRERGGDGHPPPERDVQWTNSGVEGSWRFTHRLWNEFDSQPAGDFAHDAADEAAVTLRKAAHKLIGFVTDSIEGFRFNSGVARLYEFLNVLKAAPAEGASQGVLAARAEALNILARLVAPFTPHLAEEAWASIGGEGMVVDAPWPKADPALAADDERVLPIQINGKRRGEIKVKAGAPEDEVQKIALADPNVLAHLEGVTVRKVIVVKDRIVNIVAN